MKITILGSGTSLGIPVLGSALPICYSKDSRDVRLRSAAMIEDGNCRLIIDCGPDFRQQMLAHNVPSIDGIIFTHDHADHTAGLDDIRGYCYKQGKIPIYAKKQVLKTLSQRFPYIFARVNRYPNAPEVQSVEITDRPFQVKHLTIIPINVRHGSLDILGYRIKNFAYITDAKSVPELELEKLRGLDILIINALQMSPHPSHFNLEEALKFSEKIGAGKTYFTHIGPMLGFHEAVEKLLPTNVSLAYDGLQLSLTEYKT